SPGRAHRDTPVRGTREGMTAGLPAGQPAAVTVTGPGSAPQTLTATTTINDLAAGSYDIRAQDVIASGVVYVPTPATQRIAVMGGGALTATATTRSVT